MAIWIVICVLEKIPQGFEKRQVQLEIGGRAKTIQITAFWGQPEYWEESWKPEETCCHSDLSEKLARCNIIIKELIRNVFFVSFDNLVFFSKTLLPRIFYINSGRYFYSFDSLV